MAFWLARGQLNRTIALEKETIIHITFDPLQVEINLNNNKNTAN